MHVEDIQRMPAGASALHHDGGVLTAPSLLATDGQVDVSLPLDGETAQGGIAVEALLEADVVANCIVWIADHVGQLMGKVEFAGSGRIPVDFLEQNDVRIVVPQDLRDTFEAEAPVQSDRAVNVVGEYPQFHVITLAS